jgi:chitin disaccharide deacetylase
MNDPKTIILCADDFGMNAAISRGIIDLVRARRLSAVSCMVNMPDFTLFAPELLKLKEQVQIGLHFNLTEGPLLSSTHSPFSLISLLIKSHVHWLNSYMVTAELTTQLERFIQITGFYPDFIDGHQHIHQFPIIRQALCDLFVKRLQNHSIYIRSTYPALGLSKYKVKSEMIGWTGGRALHRTLNRLHIPHNTAFAGIYDFAQGTNYRSLFRQWLTLVPENSLIMCHPGEESESADAIRHTRPQELAYLLSNDFTDDCREFGVQLATGPVARTPISVDSH